MSFSIELPTEPDGDLAADLEKQGGYVSPHVRRVEIVGRMVRYELGADVPADVQEDVHAKIGRYLHAMIARHRKIPRKVIHERARTSRRPLETHVFEQLVARRWARAVGPGQIALAGPPSPRCVPSTRTHGGWPWRRSARARRAIPR